MLEIIQEDGLRKLLETGSKCSISLLYLETGQLPARFHIQIMMLNFLKYILQQDQNSLIFKFFMAQNEQPTKGDWVSNIKKIILSTKLEMSFEDIRKMKNNSFKKVVESKVRKAAFIYLVTKIKSKGKEINYGSKLQCQVYLCPNNILTLPEQRKIFSYRARMNNLKYNFPGKEPVTEKCKCGEGMENNHLYECKVLNSLEKKVSYDKIFSGRIIEMKNVINILTENELKHEYFNQAQDVIPLSH